MPSIEIDLNNKISKTIIPSVAVKTITAGGLVIFPTSTIYGLAGNATKNKVIEKIFRIKKRPLNKPISVIIPRIKNLENVARDISEKTILLMKKFWPGKVTFVLKAHKNIPDLLTAGTGNIGVRIPNNATAINLARCFNYPLTATSANISGKPGAVLIENIGNDILNSVGLILNVGLLNGGLGSTVVDTTTNPIKILREGTISKEHFIN